MPKELRQMIMEINTEKIKQEKKERNEKELFRIKYDLVMSEFAFMTSDFVIRWCITQELLDELGGEPCFEPSEVAEMYADVDDYE